MRATGVPPRGPVPLEAGSTSASGYPLVAAALRERIESEPWARAMGIRYLDLRRGYCRVSLRLEPRMMNSLGRPHGGVIFTAADVAFGAACNSHGEAAVALSMTISYLAAAKPDSTLIAEAREARQGRRAGFYEVEVVAEDGTRVAMVHCVAHRLSR
jgi:acyl-CoA thioesterase